MAQQIELRNGFGQAIFELLQWDPLKKAATGHTVSNAYYSLTQVRVKQGLPILLYLESLLSAL